MFKHLFFVLQEKIRFLFDVLLLGRLTLHRRGIFHSKHVSLVELQKIHGTMFGEEQDNSHASKIYLGWLSVIQVYTLYTFQQSNFFTLYNSDFNFIPIFFFIFQIKKRSPLMKHIAGQQTI